MDELSRAIVAAATAPPTPEALAVMRLSLVDWVAVGIAGASEPVARILAAQAAEEGGVPQARLFGGGRAPARTAALVNGATSHALDYDDTHFAHIGHPSVAVLPAALAAAELAGATRDDLLAAALAGCEASIRFGIAFGRGHYQVGFHQTATAGTFGAALAAMRLLGGDDTALGHALGLATTRAAGLKSQFGTMGKPYNAGLAASGGLECALLAARGFVSAPEALSGQNGFLATHHCDGPAEQPPGFMMTSVSHKFHACCHGLHAALEALEALKPVDPEAVRAVEVTTHPRWLTVCNITAPETGLEAKFSYSAAVALSLLGHSTAALETFSDANARDPRVRALAERVRVVADADLAETAARVRIEGAGEATFDLAAPMPLPARAERIRSKVAALHGPARTEQLWDAVHGAEGSLEDLTALM